MPSSIEKRLNRNIGKLIIEKQLIKEGDKILVGLSGGKDSWTACYFLKAYQRKAPVKYEVVAATLDIMFSERQKKRIQKGAEEIGVQHFFIENRVTEIIEEKRKPGTSYCSFCARLRRAYLYKAAQDVGANKVALGHHQDDFVETLLMNMFYHGQIKGMPAVLKADNGVNDLIRPLLYCLETDIISFSKEKKFPIIRCACEDGVKTDKQRRNMKSLLKKLEKMNPGLKQTILTAAKNVHLGHMV